LLIYFSQDTVVYHYSEWETRVNCENELMKIPTVFRWKKRKRGGGLLPPCGT